MPELLRIEGECLLQAARFEAAEQRFSLGMAMARQHEALSWKLRCAMSTVRLRAIQGRSLGAARSVPESVYARFHEGLETADLKAAR